MRKILSPRNIALLLLLLSTQAFSQPDLEWMRQFDGYGKVDQLGPITIDAHDNIYCGGLLTNASGELDYFIIKYDVNGVRKWVKTWDNADDDFVTSLSYKTGHVYATGWSESGTDKDILTLKMDTTDGAYGYYQYPTASETKDQLGITVQAAPLGATDTFFVAATVYTTITNPDLRILKYLPNNTSIEATYGGASPEIMRGMVVDANNNAYVIGSGTDAGGNKDWVIVKYTSNSTSITQSWFATYGSAGVSDQPSAITLDGLGNVYVTGTAGGNFVTRKYTSGGAFSWSSTYAASSLISDLGPDIKTNNSYIYVAGSSDSGASATVVKYNITTGSQVWAESYAHSGTNKNSNVQVELASGGNVYLSFANGDIYLVKYDSSGTEQSVAVFDGSLGGGGDQFYTARTIPNDQSIALSGWTETSSLSSTDRDFVLVKYDLGESLLAQAGLNAAVPEEAIPSAFSLGDNYPNPFNPTTTVEFTLTGDDFLTLKVYDVLGREVKTILDNELYGQGSHKMVLDLSDLSSGSYVYKLTGSLNPGGVTKKMVLVK